jgi:TrmH family RNA methyltransferase
MQIKPYKKQCDYSYAFGAFCVYELLNSRPQDVLCVYVHSVYVDFNRLNDLCADRGVKLVLDDKVFIKIKQKENSLVFAVFSKYNDVIKNDRQHLCLVNIGDMGNLGCIIRTAAAFGFCDIAVIAPAADVFDPKTVRASMGAVFKVRIQVFDSFEDYRNLFVDRLFFPFMTDGVLELDDCNIYENNFTLVFGNEAAGLPPCFAELGTSIRIPQTEAVDSLNLSVAVGIGLYKFSKR